MDYESIIHALIDDLVSNKNGLIIKTGLGFLIFQKAGLLS